MFVFHMLFYSIFSPSILVGCFCFCFVLIIFEILKLFYLFIFVYDYSAPHHKASSGVNVMTNLLPYYASYI